MNSSEANVLKNYDNPGQSLPDSAVKAIEAVNSYQSPTPKELQAYEHIRQAVADCMRVVLENCPACEDRWAALTMLREVRMKANSSIALRGAF